jgi:hypothetical protein
MSTSDNVYTLSQYATPHRQPAGEGVIVQLWRFCVIRGDFSAVVEIVHDLNTDHQCLRVFGSIVHGHLGMGCRIDSWLPLENFHHNEREVRIACPDAVNGFTAPKRLFDDFHTGYSLFLVITLDEPCNKRL